MIHISFQQELMRLHRPFLIKATTSTEMEPSRRICVRAARVRHFSSSRRARVRSR